MWFATRCGVGLNALLGPAAAAVTRRARRRLTGPIRPSAGYGERSSSTQSDTHPHAQDELTKDNAECRADCDPKDYSRAYRSTPLLVAALPHDRASPSGSNTKSTPNLGRY